MGREGIEKVFIGKIAIDYCAKATVLDALDATLKVILLVDTSRITDVNPCGSDRAVREMAQKSTFNATLAEVG